MNNERIHRLLLSLLFSMMLGSSAPVEKYMLAGIGMPDWSRSAQPSAETPSIKSAVPAAEKKKPSSEDQNFNLFTEIIELHKSNSIPWEYKDALVINPRLCAMLFAECPTGEGLHGNVFGLPGSYENGQKITRAMAISWKSDQNNPDYVLIFRKTYNGVNDSKYDVTYYLLSPENGTAQKAVYSIKDKEKHTEDWSTATRPLANNQMFQNEADFWHQKLKQYASGQK